MKTIDDHSPDAAEACAGKYLTVILATETYGIAILKVREIIRLQKVTPVPQLPRFVRGVINLRGRVIPVLDLRAKFGLKDELTDRTCIVVAQLAAASDRTIPMGLVVDAVDEVAHFKADEIDAAPQMGASVDTAYLLGMAKVKGGVKMLLDIDRVVATDIAEAAA
jgi:purine-binding chemotaxis protein CheW